MNSSTKNKKFKFVTLYFIVNVLIDTESQHKKYNLHCVENQIFYRLVL